MLAECPANQYGTTISAKQNGISSLDNIHNNDWALYAGVEFGGSEYVKNPDSLTVTASCASTGGLVEVWLDSIDTGSKIAECTITNTGTWDIYKTFTTNILAPVSGRHDVYVKFTGSGTAKLFMLQWLIFKDNSHPETSTSVGDLQSGQMPQSFELGQNYLNPFNPSTTIHYQRVNSCSVQLIVVDLHGREVATRVHDYKPVGSYSFQLSENTTQLSSGIYYSVSNACNNFQSKKMMFIKLNELQGSPNSKEA
jgi:hypothetical protein